MILPLCEANSDSNVSEAPQASINLPLKRAELNMPPVDDDFATEGHEKF